MKTALVHAQTSFTAVSSTLTEKRVTATLVRLLPEFHSDVKIEEIPTGDFLRIVAQLDAIAESMMALPNRSAVWQSLLAGPLRVSVGGRLREIQFLTRPGLDRHPPRTRGVLMDAPTLTTERQQMRQLLADLAAKATETLPAESAGRIAKAVVALLSDWFPATTGEKIHVDGGFHAVGA